MGRNQVRCQHGNLLGKCDLCTIKFFKESYWVDGWALDAYTNREGKTVNGALINSVKYHLAEYPLAAEEKAKVLLETLKDFLVKVYPNTSRPFDCLICPPSNTQRKFQLMEYIGDELSNAKILNRSNELIKVSIHPTVKAMSGKERFDRLPHTMKLTPSEDLPRPKGILIIDDVLGTGNTAKETCRALDAAWPGVPKFFVALTYLMDWSRAL
jgi:hypothetical protein